MKTPFALCLVPLLAFLPLACGGSTPDQASSSPDGGDVATDGGADGKVDPTPHTVTGSLVDFYGNPIADAKIAIGDTTTTTTGADGSFSIVAPHLPYDLIAIVPKLDGQTYDTVLALEGVTLTKIVVRSPSAATNVKVHYTTLTVPATGQGVPIADGQTLLAALTAPNIGLAQIESSEGSMFGTDDVPFSGTSDSVTTDIFGFLVDGTHTQLLAQGKASGITLHEGVALTTDPIALTATTDVIELTGTVHAPPGFDAVGACSFGPSGTSRYEGVRLYDKDNVAPDTFHCIAPKIAGWDLQVTPMATIKGTGQTGITNVRATASNAAFDVTIAMPPKLATPSGTDFAASQTITWTPSENTGAKSYRVELTELDSGLEMYFWTASTTWTLPKASLTGVTIPAGKKLTFAVDEYDGVSVDDVINGADVNLAAGGSDLVTIDP